MKSGMENFLNNVEAELDSGGLSYLNRAQLSVCLKVIEDRMWGKNNDVAQRCNDLQKLIFKD